ncbi:hypothetical protein [Janthinobacterium sp. LB2P10]|uniref:hypothetical protein n=1 Tax=Janthinobacterium sp. LB2P10 TaxID=3424194 RepID=UPI003F250328
MAKIIIHAGDFTLGEGDVRLPLLFLKWQMGDGFSGVGKSIPLTGSLESITVASEDEVKRVGGALGWGAAGAALLGPVGLLAGLLLGGKGKDVTFIAHFKDGKKMLATTDSKTFTGMQALVF